jgi:hypothetical protein
VRKTAIAHAHGAKNSHGWWGRWDLTPQFVGLLTPPRACIRAQITYTTKLTQLNETMNAFRSSRISFDEVLRLYRAILRETGGEYGFVSEGTLRYILDSMDSIRGDIFAKAAYAIHGIATKHPLVNGNKRLAFALAGRQHDRSRRPVAPIERDHVSMSWSLSSCA